ncbi:glycosyltransferase family 1 protein [Daedalea quercina L-15889]|uniref:sterol 3beta-glucosyltransferase n=1 Tax=Daedalea quercina L-15889 TaxID=1314783 RepID=A0A165UHB7_9APHY|nr:glycosyltransferase family 1 protein [Daedalea quercina L-15889]
MHAGTQTLIQALQAMPWAEIPDDEDCSPQGGTPTDTSSDDEDDRQGTRLASSIHTIYRPLARSKRGKLSTIFSRPRSPNLEPVVDREETPRIDEAVVSDEELQDDFEPPYDTQDTQDIPHDGGETASPRSSSSIQQSIGESHVRHPPSRSGSMGTVKMQRRSRLAEKLRDIFDLQGIQEVVAEMPCWLLRSILLQGYMYLTDSYLCFFAHMPLKEDQVLKSGSLSKRAQRTKRWIRHWFVLKNDALSWYQSPLDPYFPHGIVDLRYAIDCEPLYEKDIRLRSNQKTIRLSADSTPSRDEWVKAIRRVMFRAQNMGDSVKIAIPYSAIADVDKSSAIDFSETIEVKVMDKDHPSATDSYFFAYFRDLPAALEQIRDVVRASRGITVGSHSVIDTTVTALRTQSTPITDHLPKSPSGFRIPSLLRPLQESLPRVRSTVPAGRATSSEREDSEDYTHVAKRGSSTFMTVTTSPTSSVSPEDGGSPPPEGRSSSPPNPALHTYPPSPSSSPTTEIITSSSKDSGLWTVGVPSWLRMPAMPSIPSRRALTNVLGGIRSGEPRGVSESGSVSEVVSSNTGPGSRMSASSSGPNDFGYFSILETPAATLDDDSVEKFRTSFAFDEKETLLGVIPGYIYRLLPVYGRLYVSTNFFCFKSSGPLTTRTRMILPIRDILSTEISKAFHFGHYGLVIVVRGHEELFFEFSDEERRDAFVSLLDQQMEYERRRSPRTDTCGSTPEPHSTLILDEVGPRQPSEIDSRKAAHEASMSESLPAVMFNSASSTFLTFKPDKSLHFTFLTIGSRGDVQPYIALAKGLMKDGHRCRIATHAEFKDWIEAYGIEFGYVGGDPAELMRICVENGTFTVAFLKEGMLKFRGWLDDLLKTSWEACQGTDVLIESPSAMSGYHIAEALGVPYFRAFTMTWTRTRAYPHAFAVPEHKMGGNYNYMSFVLFDQVFWRATAGQINRWRRNTLGLSSTSLDRMEPHKIPFLYNFSPVVVPPPLDWPEWIHVTGYWFLNDADVSSKKWSPPPDLIEFLDSARRAQKKVIYIGFGSIVVSDPKSMTRCVIDAVVRSGVYAILSKGWSDRLVKDAIDSPEPEDPLPKQIYPIASIPHDWLFQRVDAACHHGGAGTTGASLRGGIPTIIKPFFGDQFFWADRVEALGIGSAVRKLTVESLTQAFVTATTDQRQIARAKAVGEKIRAEDGVGTAIEAIYRDLEYARSLVKGPAVDELQEDTFDAEHATIRDHRQSSVSPRRSGARSGSSSVSSAHDAPSDWSVISDQE